MPTIDQENAKQIRQPMDVLITMPLAADDITLTFSGYSSSSKVADGRLNMRNWPMRKLADLQGDGFLLDGSAVLYNPNTTPSQTNGKLGVRGNVGETVSVTVTGNKAIPALSISVTGAESVTYNGITKAITGATVSVPVLTTSITLSFSPASGTERIEISNIEAESDFVINNENLIRAIVSLRSDLSLFDQTLPESEINIEAYHPVDVAEDVANIPADTPIIYQAGYEGDMSPERRFYVSGQVTWADNVLSIHAVDAVHFLDDINIVAPVTQKDSEFFANSTRYVLERAGINYDDSRWRTSWWSDSYRWIIPENTNARTWIAFMNQCFNLTDNNGRLLDGSATLQGRLQFAYIDAGIPTIRTQGTSGEFEIDETDCANINKEIDQKYGTITTNWRRLTKEDADTGEGSVFKVGSATMQKNVGTSLNFEHYAESWEIGLFLGRNYDNEIAKKLQAKYQVIFGYGYTQTVVPGNTNGDDFGSGAAINIPYVGQKLMIGEIPQEEARNYPVDESYYDYSSFVPWTAKYNGWRYDNNASHLIKSSAQMWNVLKNANIIDASAESIDLDIYGWAYVVDPQQKKYTVDESGTVYDYSDSPIIGRVAARKSNNTMLEIFPSKMLSVPMYRSKVKGSFTWKGDPRLQPRAHGTFKRKDGTDEEITLENITLTHEGGGTSAEITYRKGVI